MSKYEDLCAAYAAWNEANAKYHSECCIFAGRVVGGFADYLGIPPIFEDRSGSLKQYMSYYEVTNEDELRAVAGRFDAVSHNPDGSFDFGFGVVIGVQPNLSTRIDALVRLVCDWKGNTVRVRLDEDEVEVTFDGSECPDIERVHQLIFDRIDSWLGRRPEKFLEEQIKIGFGT